MKIIKSENEAGKIEKIKGGWGKVSETFKKENAKRNIIVLCAIALIGGAIYLNWVLFASDVNASNYTPTNQNPANTQASSGNVQDPVEDESYFAMAQLNRTNAYDNAYDTLLAITTSTTATDEAKNAAYTQITVMATNIQAEANIETLIKAKGFEECVAVISDDHIDVIVKSNGLLPNQIAQIQEIVVNQSGIIPTNIKIVEKS